MDGRRHSVDAPISRTLIALRRVRSLRDPSTNSITQLPTLADDLNWETNSNNAITLGFNNGFQEWGNENPVTDLDQHASDHELYYGSRHNSGGPSCNVRRMKLRGLSRVIGGDVLSRSGSPRLSNVSFTGSCHQGCGISSCWSKPRKYRENVEKRPLLLIGDTPYSESSPRNLCQKFAPKSFSELVGQNEVANSLLNAISKRQISPLYLFHGPHGTGKTSTSRIFAAALNCLSSDFQKPCCLCLECSSFFTGESRDVKEFDALSVNKMGKCISLAKGLWAPPLFSRFKVIVIEECHLLHRETWAVILSGLEKEMPRNIVFIMLTADPDRVPSSVLSRFQGYRFQSVSEGDMVMRLGEICIREGVDFEEEALTFIASKSDGSVRDAEMMLDQMSLLGKKITVPLVYEVNGVVSNDELLDLLHLALSADASNTVKRARELLRSRIEPLQLVSQLANLIMDILAGKFPDGVSEVTRKLFGTDNSEADMQQLSNALKILSQTEKQLRTSRNQTTWLTVALLQLSSAGSSLHDMTEARLSTRTLNPPEAEFHNTSSTGESLKCCTVACTCEDDDLEKIGAKDDKDALELELVWLRAIGICTPHSFRKFLFKQGKLVDIRLVHGTTVAELEFDYHDHVSKAEKSWKVIAGALQQTLGYNVELRINLTNKEYSNKHLKLKRPYFGLFNCSRRMHLKSHFCSVNSDLTPTDLTRDQYVKPCLSESGSQISHVCSHGGNELLKTIRSKDGNALSIRMDTLGMPRDDKSAVNNIINKRIKEIKTSRKEGSKFRCWKTAMFPFRKAWRLLHQPQNDGIGGQRLTLSEKVADQEMV